MTIGLWLLLAIIPVLFIARRLIRRNKISKEQPNDIYPIF